LYFDAGFLLSSAPMNASKSYMLLLAPIVMATVSQCPSRVDLAKQHINAYFQQVPNSKPPACIIYIPYRYQDWGGKIAGSLTVSEVPGLSGGLNYNDNWGFLPYYGLCGDPSTWKGVQIPIAGGGGAKPNPSATPDPAQAVATKANQVGVGIVKGSEKAKDKPKPQAELASAIMDSVPFYMAVNSYSKLKPYDKNTLPAEKAILGLDKTANALAGSEPGAAPLTVHPPVRKKQIEVSPKSIVQKADQLVEETSAL
jgi:hypothetical protein